jgi:hypothetical protein
MRKTVTLRKNRDGTVLLRAGRYVESFDPFHLTKDELVDRVRWIAITGNVSMSEDSIRDLLRENRLVA